MYPLVARMNGFGCDPALLGRHYVRAVGGQLGDQCAFIYLRPYRCGCLRQPKGQAQRVDMPRAAVQHAARVGLGADQRRQLRAIQRLDLRIVIALRQHLGLVPGFAHLAIEPAATGDAVAPARINAVIVDHPAQRRLRILGQIPQRPGRTRAQPPLKPALPLVEPTPHLSAIAPGGAKADPMCFDHHDIQTGLRQVQGCAEPCVTRADDADVCAGVAPQRGKPGAAGSKWRRTSCP